MTVSQPMMNIGMVGHVDHGKTTLTQALTGKWTDQHSEEMKRGISIKLGYADANFYKINPKKGDSFYTSEPDKEEYLNFEKEYIGSVSFVDAPGHETLMAVMLSGAAIMDNAILIIAANEKCPQPQTREHLSALEIMGLTNVLVVQNKIDICSEERAMESYQEIKDFLSESSLSEAPIIPVSAHHNRNIDVLIEFILTHFNKSNQDNSQDFSMNIARSFDINKPGTKPAKLQGGVIGGSISKGSVKIGDAIEIAPGRKIKNNWKNIVTKVESLYGGGKREELESGGLVAIGTSLDPSVTKADSLTGGVVGSLGSLPPVWDDFRMKVTLLDRVVGAKIIQDVDELKVNEPLMLSVGSSTTVGIPTKIAKDTVSVNLKLSVCAPLGQRIAISRRVEGRWHLIGYGILEE